MKPFVILLFVFLTFSCSRNKSLTADSTNPKEESNYVKDEFPNPSDKSTYTPPSIPEAYKDEVFLPNIKTPLLYVAGQPLSFPVLFLGDSKQLELSFDDLSANYQTYSYEFIHCNADWRPSNLTQQEYLEGFMSGFIEDYFYSYNTLNRFINYKLIFPNEQTSFKLSGNYILKVYANNDREKPVLTRRFLVVQEKIKLDANIHMATLARYRDYKQEIDFTLNLGNYNVVDPFQDLQVHILQNRRWDNAITNLKPLYVRTPELIYNYEENNLFDGGNEFRFFDAKNLRYQSLNVDGIQIINKNTHLFVLAEEPRSYKRYYYWQDLNGNRLIKRDESPNSNREADYVQAHFTLKRETPVPFGDVYIFGQLSDWQCQEQFKMTYVEIDQEYRCEVQLKQGYYNYSYVVLPKGKEEADMAVIEGTHSETENEYYFLVYHRKNGEIYDRLVGFEIKNSYRGNN